MWLACLPRAHLGPRQKEVRDTKGDLAHDVAQHLICHWTSGR